MSIQHIKNHLDVFNRDAGICRYCKEDLLWSYSVFMSSRFDRISTAPDGWVTCCPACYQQLKDCCLLSLDERRAFIQQQTQAEINQYRAMARELRSNVGGSGALAQLVQAGILRNDDMIYLDNQLPSFLRHPPGDPAYQAIIKCTRGGDIYLIYLLDGREYEFSALTFDIFQRGHLSAPYRKTRFSWSVCPSDHWVTKAKVSLTELRVRLDWDDLPADGKPIQLPEFVEKPTGENDPFFELAKVVLQDDEEFPVSFLQRRFRIGYSRACRLYGALGSLRNESRRIP